MPDAAAVRAAIGACPFVVVSDITAKTDTARLADVVLPAAAWAEKDGTVTNSDRTISRQRAVLPIPGEAKPDWEIMAEVGSRMGFGASFDYANPAEIFREYATLSGIAGAFGKDFDISGLSDLSDSDYDALEPVRWPVSADRRGGRFFADGQFFHADGKARMLPVSARPPASVPTPDTPFRLNTGRLRDQWHTMTRTALAPRLSGHLPEPFVDIHPEDARSLRISAADLVELTNDHGSAILRARITTDVQPGHLFAPIHWTGETAPSARIDDLVTAHVDPVSGQPESKACTVAAARFDARWYGFAVSATPLHATCDYWAVARTTDGFRAELAGSSGVADWEAQARVIFGDADADLTSILDAKRRTARVVLHRDGTLIGALYVAPTPVAVMRDYLATLPGRNAPEAITGRVPASVPNPGPVLCSCFGTGINTIVSAIESKGLMSVDQIGEALGAGTNCGSCRPELAQLLARTQVREAAE